MAIFASNIITSDSALGSAKIQKSLRFNDDDSSYLLRTPSSNGNRQTWTFSAWVKRSNITTGTYPTIFQLTAVVIIQQMVHIFGFITQTN